jgi:plasmid stabilization system protein ParE
MTRFAVTFSATAKADIQRLYDFLADIDPDLAERALIILDEAWDVLSKFPHTCRKAQGGELGATWRELLITFGSSGYIALFQITSDKSLTVAAVRHQRESDYH